jgi:hypothetical protein
MRFETPFLNEICRLTVNDRKVTQLLIAFRNVINILTVSRTFDKYLMSFWTKECDGYD